MKKYLLLALALVLSSQVNIFAQEEEEKEKTWTVGGAVGVDFAEMLFVNPKFGAGENKIGIGGNISFFAKYKKGRTSWDNFAGLSFGIQRLGTFEKEIPFQKSVDELRISSNFAYGLTDESPFGYSLDVLFLSQITPTYEGNILSPISGTTALPIAEFASPATLTVSPGLSFKKATKFGTFTAMLSPASLKMIMVSNDAIARLGLHGNPFTQGDSSFTAAEFTEDWRVEPDGMFTNAEGNVYYSKNYLQFGANLKAAYAHKFFKYKEGDTDKHRLVLGTSVSLYSNYMRLPQHVDVEWITNVDVFLFKGLSISLMTNLSWDYDIFVQVNADGDIDTGVNGYEDKGRRVSFMQSLLIKYNFLF
jgi:hypothetical protein